MSTMELVRRAGIEYLAYPALENVDMKEMIYSKPSHLSHSQFTFPFIQTVL